jgi:hypothetical protein
MMLITDDGHEAIWVGLARDGNNLSAAFNRTDQTWLASTWDEDGPLITVISSEPGEPVDVRTQPKED